MKHLFIIAVLIMACSAKAQDFSVKPIMIQECAPIPPIILKECTSIPEDLKSGKMPMGYEPGFKIFLMISGKDMRAFKKDSLSIEYIKTKDGQNISKSRSGKTNYKMDTFPTLTEDGKTAFFSIESNENVFGAVETLQIKGLIKVLASNKVETANTKELEFEKSESQKAGLFTVTTNPKAGANRLNFPGNDKTLIVEVKGPIESISNISFVVDGKDDKSNGWGGYDDSRTYLLKSTNANKVAVKINYWADLKEKSVPFEINLGKQ